MSETPPAENPFASVTWPESYPDATQSADSGPPAVVTPPQQTPAEIAVSGAAMRKEWGGYTTLKEYRDAQAKWACDAVSGAIQARIAPNGEYIPLGAVWSEQEQKVVPMQLVVENLDTAMRVCGQADDEAPATGTEAQVCRDIAKRQRRGLAKYGKTVIANNLSFAQWLQHFYEELLDGAIYAKRILTMNHEPENETDSDGSAAGVLPDNANPPNRHRKPGAGRKPKPCPNCGATKSIGSTVKNGIPTRRCKACGFVVQTYPHLANVKAPA